MPAKNSIKFYLSNSIYHIYNRGVEKRTIFEDNQDYNVFLGYLKEYLSPSQGEALGYRDYKGKFVEEIKLLTFCLMPNHFHLLIKQKGKDSIKKFTQALFTRYSMYFNKKYKRIGSLFQGEYRAVNIIDKEHLLYVSKYIHRNPITSTSNLNVFSSYSDYLGITNTPWLDKKVVLNEFNKSIYIKFNKINSYQEFVEKWDKDLPNPDIFDLS
ncbi:MAG: transposase [Patescibacteria group bacterium]